MIATLSNILLHCTRNCIFLLQFLDVLKEVTNNDTEVIHLIEKRYSKANPTYTSSSQFLELIRKVQEKIECDAPNKYIHVKELTDELKAFDSKHTNKQKRRNLKKESDSDSSGTAGAAAKEKPVPSSTSHAESKTTPMASKRGLNGDTEANLDGPQQKKARRIDVGKIVTEKDKVVFVDFPSGSDGNAQDAIEISSTSEKSEHFLFIHRCVTRAQIFKTY